MPIIDRARIAAALPGYVVGRELGAGALGLVLAARHVELRRDVAVKVLDLGDTRVWGSPAGPGAAGAGGRGAGGAAGGPPGPPADVPGEENTAGGGHALTLLEHPHLCRVYEVVTAGGLRLLVTELLPGGTLARQSLTQQAACAVTLAVADALMHAHATGILHRDIKPANILFTADGTPKLTDLGVMELAEQAAGGPLVGTPQYMAPEQITGGRLSPATDVYALAATLYELLTGSPLFGAGLPTPELFRRHCEVAPPPPAGVPEPVARVLGRALAKQPAARHPTAAQFALDLAEAARLGYGPGWLDLADIPLSVGEALLDRGTGPRGSAGAEAGSPARPAGPDGPGGPGRPGLGDLDDDGDTTYRLPPGEVAALPPVFPALSAPSGRSGAAEPEGPAGGAGEAAPAGQGGTTKPLFAGTGAAAGAAGPGGATPAARRRPRRLWISVAVVVALLAAAAAVVLPRALDGSDNVAGDRQGPPPTGPTSPPPAPPAPQTNDPAANVPSPFTVMPFAGVGRPGASGDGGPANTAALNSPFGLAADGVGNVYVADFDNHRVRRIGPDGIITTIAGTGEAGFSGDGGPATEAALQHPSAVAVDVAGNIYIADTFNHRIRRITPNGIITTIAGTDDRGFDGDGGPATEAVLWYPSGIAVDPVGNVYVADAGNDRVRRIGLDGVIVTVAGMDGEGSHGDGGPAAEALLAFPLALAMDRHGRLYIADSDNHRIRRINLDGVIETIAGTGMPGFSGDGGPATEATLRGPRGVAVDAAGNVYITDRNNNRIRRVDPNGIITTIAGTAPPGRDMSTDPDALRPDGSVAVSPNGRVIYVSDRAHHRILRIEPAE